MCSLRISLDSPSVMLVLGSLLTAPSPVTFDLLVACRLAPASFAGAVPARDARCCAKSLSRGRSILQCSRWLFEGPARAHDWQPSMVAASSAAPRIRLQPASSQCFPTWLCARTAHVQLLGMLFTAPLFATFHSPTECGLMPASIARLCRPNLQNLG